MYTLDKLANQMTGKHIKPIATGGTTDPSTTKTKLAPVQEPSFEKDLAKMDNATNTIYANSSKVPLDNYIRTEGEKAFQAGDMDKVANLAILHNALSCARLIGDEVVDKVAAANAEDRSNKIKTILGGLGAAGAGLGLRALGGRALGPNYLARVLGTGLAAGGAATAGAQGLGMVDWDESNLPGRALATIGRNPVTAGLLAGAATSAGKLGMDKLKVDRYNTLLADAEKLRRDSVSANEAVAKAQEAVRKASAGGKGKTPDQGTIDALKAALTRQEEIATAVSNNLTAAGTGLGTFRNTIDRAIRHPIRTFTPTSGGGENMVMPTAAQWIPGVFGASGVGALAASEYSRPNSYLRDLTGGTNRTVLPDYHREMSYYDPAMTGLATGVGAAGIHALADYALLGKAPSMKHLYTGLSAGTLGALGASAYNNLTVDYPGAKHDRQAPLF